MQSKHPSAVPLPMDDKTVVPPKNKDKKQVERNFSLFNIVWELAKMYKEVFSNGAAVIKTLKTILGHWEDAIAKIQKIMDEDIAPFIAEADDTDEKDKNSPNLNTAWKIFTINLKNVSARVTKLKNAFSDANSTEKTLVADGNELLQQLRGLFDSFDSLGLNAKLKSILPDSLESFKNSINQLLEENVRNIIPVDLEKRLAEFHDKSHAYTVEEFAELPHYQQDPILLLSWQVNYMMQDLFAHLDKWGIELTVKEGFLTNKKFDFLGKKSLREHCEKFTHLYIEYMRVAGYEVDQELYPFTDSLNAQRVAMLADVTSKLAPEEKLTQYEEKQTKLKSIAIVAARINEIGMSFYNNPKPVLEKLLRTLSLPNNKDIHSALKSMTDAGVDLTLLYDGDNAIMLEKLKDNYAQLDKSIAQRCAHLRIKKKNLERRLAKHAAELKDVKAAPKANKEEVAHKIADVLGHANKRLIPKLQGTVDRGMAHIFGKKSDAKAANKKGSSGIINTFNAIDKQLKDMLDENVYELFFTKSMGNPKRLLEEELHVEGMPDYKLIADFAEEKQDKRPWIQDIGQAVAGIKQCATTLRTTFLDKKSVASKEKTPALNLMKTIDKLEGALDNINNVTDSFDQLMEDDFIQQFTSGAGITAYAQSLIDPVMKHTSLLNDLIIPKGMKGDSGLESMLSRIEQFYNKHNQNESKDAKAAVPAAILGLMQSLKLWNQYNPDGLEKLGKWNYLVFAIKNHDMLFSQLLGNTSLAIASLRDVAGDFALELAQKFNFFLQDLFLVLDQVEIQFYLKEGYLNNLKIFGQKSLRDIAKDFNSIIENTGYKIKPEERFPYTVKIMEQREEMLAHATSRFERQFIEKRLPNHNDQKANNQKKDKSKMLAKITARLDELKQENEKSYSVIKVKKINLLEKMKAKIAAATPRVNDQLNDMTTHHMDRPEYHFIKSNGDSKDEAVQRQMQNMAMPAIESVNEYLDTMEDIHLLYEGRTGNLVKELQYFAATKTDVLNRIDLEIELLKQKRGETYYFFAASRRTVIEDSIVAFKLLRTIMETQGYGYDEAIAELKTRNQLAHYDVLFQHQNAALREICKLDKFVSKESRGEKLADKVKSTPITQETNSMPLPPVVNINPNIDQKHVPANVMYMPVSQVQEQQGNKIGFFNHLIQRRIDELQSAWIITSTKATKIRLLNELRENLGKKLSLENAIAKLKSNPVNKSCSYLLFEGKTGNMMKEFEYSQLTKEDMLHRIELEIIRLQSQRTEHLYFHAQQRKQELEQRIHALIELKNVFGDLRDLKVGTLMDHLRAGNVSTLLTHEHALMQDLELWQHANKQVQPRRSIVI